MPAQRQPPSLGRYDPAFSALIAAKSKPPIVL
jgi:hypothetical protein